MDGHLPPVCGCVLQHSPLAPAQLVPPRPLTLVDGKAQLLDHGQVPIDPVNPIDVKAWGQRWGETQQVALC